MKFTKADGTTTIATVDCVNGVLKNSAGSEYATTADIIKYSIIFG